MARRSLVFTSLLASSLASTYSARAPAQPAEEAGREGATLQARLDALVDRPGGLTAEEAASRARATSYDVKDRRAESLAAQAGVDQAALGFLPRVSARGSYMRLSDVGTQSLGNLVGASPGTPLGPVAPGTPLANVPVAFTYPNDTYALQADVSVPLSDYVLRLTKQYASAKHSARAAELSARAAELAVASSAKMQYYAWARTRVHVVVANAALELARQHLADAKSLRAAGQASAADVLQIEARAAEHELFVLRADNAVVTAEDRLRTAMHESPARHYEIGEPLLGDIAPLAGENELAALLREADAQRWEIRAVRETEGALRAHASTARAAVLPRLDAIGSALYANPNPRYFPPPAAWNGTWAVGAAISWTSSDAILGGTGASAAEARADGAVAKGEAIREGIRDEVMRAYESLHDAEAAVVSSQRSLSAAEESYRVRRALFRAGQATSTELSDAENALTRARVGVVNSRIDLRVAHVEMNHATGRDGLR